MKLTRETSRKILTAAIALFLVMGIFSVASHVFADTLDKYVPLAPLPAVGEAEANDLPKYLKAVFQIALGLAAALSVVMITIGGIEYMSTDSIFGKEEGMKKVNGALKGLLLAIMSWLILYTVNPRTLEFNFNPEVPKPVIPSAKGTIPGREAGTYFKIKTCTIVPHPDEIDQTTRTEVTSLGSFAPSWYGGSIQNALGACQSYPPLDGSQNPAGTRCTTITVECTTTRPN